MNSPSEQLRLHDDEPTVEELEREYKTLFKQQQDITRELIKLSQFITRKKKYREWIK